MLEERKKALLNKPIPTYSKGEEIFNYVSHFIGFLFFVFALIFFTYKSIINKYDFPNKYIEIELTETSTDVDFKNLKRIVTGLTDHGIHTSIDDFGMGYSSLNLLRELPWNTLKIDRSLLPTSNDDSSSLAVILQHVIAMAQTLGIECIAEGVETVEQIDILKRKKCFLAQGFYFDKPLEKEEFTKRLLEL